MTEPAIRDEWVEKAARAAYDCTDYNRAVLEDARVIARAALTAVVDDIRADALREMGDWFQLASQLGTGERDDIAAQACYDRADRIGGRHE